MKYLFTIVSLLYGFSAQAQLYFPPNGSSAWDTLSPSSLGWCQPNIDSLYAFLDSNNTKAFILLKDGKIVLEQYFDGHTASDNWYWASAGKTLTAFTVGIAQQEGYLSIADPTSQHLGQGWTACTPTQEAAITVRHQLTMTTGLDDNVPEVNCTLDTCLQYLAAPGTRWAYHNAPYTLLGDVVANATGRTYNAYLTQKVKSPIGMGGAFLASGYSNVYYSTARSMARFGLLILNKGNWNGTPIMTDTTYFNAMVTPSQSINESYGYLWWLNGQNSFMIPQSQSVILGSMNPNAPSDMVSGLGKDGQFLNIAPSRGMVMIRMGGMPGSTLVPFTFNDDIWERINRLDCILSTTALEERAHAVGLYPNPVQDYIHLQTTPPLTDEWSYQLYDCTGRCLQQGSAQSTIAVADLVPGVYTLVLSNGQQRQTLRVVKAR